MCMVLQICACAAGLESTQKLEQVLADVGDPPSSLEDKSVMLLCTSRVSHAVLAAQSCFQTCSMASMAETMHS